MYIHYFISSSQASEMSTIYYHIIPHSTDDKIEAQKEKLIILGHRSSKQKSGFEKEECLFTSQSLGKGWMGEGKSTEITYRG